MQTIYVKQNDVPKLYMSLQDIYGNNFAIPYGSLEGLTYTVYTVSGSTRTAVTGFSNVQIPSSNYYTTAQTYPTEAKGLTASAREAGYNVVVYPFTLSTSNGTSVWTSPFTEANATYDVDVIVKYWLSDANLSSIAVDTKTFSIRIKTNA